MAKTPKAGAPTRSFSHLLGLSPKPAMKGPKAEADDEKRPGDEKDKDDKEAKGGGARAEQQPDTDDDGKAQCAVCEGEGVDEDGDKCQACDGTGEVGDGDDETTRDRDAARAESEDDDETKGRKAERTRWSRVMANKATSGKVAVACHLLSTTDMKSSAVISALADMPGAQASSPRDTLYSRMSAERTPNPGAEASRAPAKDDFAAQMAAAVGLVRAPKK